VLVLVAVVLGLGCAAWYWQRSRRPEQRMERGRAAIQAQDWETAADVADALEAAGHRDRANLLRGESLFRQGRLVNALGRLKEIEDQGAIRLEAVALSGRCLLKLGNLREASRAYRFVLSQQPEHVDAHRGLAAIAYDLGNLQQASGHLQEVARLDPRDGKSHRLRGLILKFQSLFPEAEEAYLNALSRELPPNFRLEVYLELAECRAERREYASALEALGERAGAGPEGALALAVRGECLWGLGRGEEARALLEGALREHPNDAKLLGLRGQIHLANGEAKTAADVLERALRGDPHNGNYRDHLARAYVQLGRHADAAEHLRRAEESEKELRLLAQLSIEAMSKPWDAEVRFRLADYWRKHGKPDLAAMWDRAAQACQEH
jgi:tetratricopeptide (TPR) repeat protein